MLRVVTRVTRAYIKGVFLCAKRLVFHLKVTSYYLVFFTFHIPAGVLFPNHGIEDTLPRNDKPNSHRFLEEVGLVFNKFWEFFPRQNRLELTFFSTFSPLSFPKYALFLASFSLIWENQKVGTGQWV